MNNRDLFDHVQKGSCARKLVDQGADAAFASMHAVLTNQSGVLLNLISVSPRSTTLTKHLETNREVISALADAKADMTPLLSTASPEVIDMICEAVGDMTPYMHGAILAGDVTTMHLLKDRSIDVQACLRDAVRMKNAWLTVHLIEARGAEVTSCVILQAAASGDVDMVKTLIQHKGELTFEVVQLLSDASGG